jgi:PAS domain S-box-containing protein
MMSDRHSELLLGTLAAVGEGVSIYDAELKLVAANDRLRELLALPPELARPGTPIRDVLRFQVARGDFGTGEQASVDYRLRNFWRDEEIEFERASGHRTLRGRRRRLAGGGFVTIYTDITAAKQTEAALRESEARFKDFAEAASDWLWEWDTEGRFTWISERVTQALGRPQAFFVGKRREDIGRIDVEDPSWKAHQVQIAQRQAFSGFRYRSVYPERVRWFEHSGKPIFAADGSFLGYRGTGREVTALVEAEDQARLGRERLAGAIAALPHAVGQFDRDGRLVAFNDAYKRMHAAIADIFKVGLPFEQLLHAALSIQLPAIPEDEAAAYVERRMAYHRNPKGTFERPLANGVWQEIIETPLPDGGFMIIIHDITARKRAEAEANRAQAQLAGALDGMPLVITLYDAEDRLVAGNRAYVELLKRTGLPMQIGMSYEALVRTMFEHGRVAVPESEREEHIARRMAFHANPVGTLERRLHDGLWQEIHEFRLPDGGLMVMMVDITERKRAEAEANRAQAQLAGAIDGMPLVIGVFDAEDRIVTWNRAYAELLARNGLPLKAGMTFEQLVRNSIDHGRIDVPKAEREKYFAERMAFHANPVGSFERQFADGIWQELQEFRLPDGGLMLLMADITERKRAEAALRHSEQRLSLHRDHTPLGAVEWDPEGRVVAWNAAAEHIFGYRREEIIGRRSAELIIPAHVRPKVAATLQAVWRGEGGRRSTNENLTKDGRIIVCDWYNTPLIDADGRVMGVASLVQDITQRIKAEAELREAKEAAEASDRTKSEFLANISHELRTPLNAIIGFSEVIAEAMMGPVGTPRYTEYARDIRNSGVHLLSIINDLLDISKIEAGRFELHEETAAPHELLEASIRLVRERAEKAGLRCEMLAPTDLPQLAVDPRAMKQILLNLLSNAVKFTPSGGSVRANAHLDAAGGLVFAVADTGIGMRPEDIPRALAPFTQIDSQFSRRHEGTGLGLPLAKKLVELHGGSLDLASTPGQGTTVTVRLPPTRVILPRRVANQH